MTNRQHPLRGAVGVRHRLELVTGSSGRVVLSGEDRNHVGDHPTSEVLPTAAATTRRAFAAPAGRRGRAMVSVTCRLFREWTAHPGRSTPSDHTTAAVTSRPPSP